MLNHQSAVLNGLDALPEVIRALNNESTCMIRKKPSDVLRAKSVAQKPSLPVVELDPPLLPSYSNVRYLFQLGELGGGRRLATAPIWSLKVCYIKKVICQKNTSTCR